MLGRVSLIVGLITLVAAADSGPGPLRPTTMWNLDYGYTQCTALRNYGDAQNPVTLGVVQSPGGDTYELVVGRQQKHSDYPEELQGSVDFGSGQISSWLLRYASVTGNVTIDQFRITSAQMAQARSDGTVVFRVHGAADLAFALSDMSALLDGMQKCTTDLRNFWNMDDRSGRVAVPAKGDVRAVFTADDYPKLALFRSQEGTAQFLILIDEKGGVAGCHVVSPSGVPILDAMGCAVIQKRTKLRPAKNPSGKSVRSAFVTPPIRWQMAATTNVPIIER